MHFNVKEKYNCIVVKAPAKLIGGSLSEEMRNILHNYVEENKKNVIVDLGEVNVVNSTGIGILISGFTTMKNAGGDLKLANLNTKTEGLLSITKLNTVFDIHKNVEEAIESFKLKIA